MSAKMVLGYACFRVVMLWPTRWWSNGRAFSWILAWAGYYAYAPSDLQSREGR